MGNAARKSSIVVIITQMHKERKRQDDRSRGLLSKKERGKGREVEGREEKKGPPARLRGLAFTKKEECWALDFPFCFWARQAWRGDNKISLLGRRFVIISFYIFFLVMR